MGSTTNVASLVLHGAVQLSSQALAFCVEEGVGVHWFSGSGRYVGSVGVQSGSIHRRIAQFEALRDGATRLGLARRLVTAKVEGDLRFLLRASREDPERRAAMASHVRDLRAVLTKVRHAPDTGSLLGLEGAGAARYFAALPLLLSRAVSPELCWNGRSRRPPLDRFNALMSFFYGLVHREVEAAILSGGLDSAFGFYHRPRNNAGPLALDIMELFRVALADMPVVASVNRNTWDVDGDFEVATKAGVITRVWLSPEGRKKALEIYERRRRETWKHSGAGGEAFGEGVGGSPRPLRDFQVEVTRE